MGGCNSMSATRYTSLSILSDHHRVEIGRAIEDLSCPRAVDDDPSLRTIYASEFTSSTSPKANWRTAGEYRSN